jgi:hypothetical protein
MFSVLPVQSSYDVLPLILFDDEQFNSYTAIVTASPQNAPGRSFAFNMLRAVPTTVWFRRSTTPFFAEVNMVP